MSAIVLAAGGRMGNEARRPSVREHTIFVTGLTPILT